MTDPWIELKKNMDDDLVIFIVGNKLDLAVDQREVPIEKTEDYVMRVLDGNCDVYEVSAKEDNGSYDDEEGERCANFMAR